MKAQIIDYLLEEGFRPHYKGFDYLVSALEITTASKSRVPVGILYSKIAEDYDVTWQCVERCIRTAIESYWDAIKAPGSKPTNAEYIALATVRLKVKEDAL